MKSKLFIIEVRLFGEWKPLSDTEYAEADKREMADMQSQISDCRNHGVSARRRCVGERNLQRLTVRPMRRAN